ncbi:hypothetical protein [Paramicrobacterium agarici]|uniref:DUF7882 domain-containing protein n=1 Tax=Paramicrobacterium agarici TaxID=630514 RepID=A0A2A9DR26_9MICO|nr:hypothetical protein [Microbacterium agarici]PFG29217.1 hypothetical protein ATJ78_0116 [Microbacterium agarici]TQO22181.1 hypothetical protein FB385_1002 [Microbacterium agarici]
MGYLQYGSASEYEFDDRTLAHLKVVVVSRLRRQESFLLSWATEPSAGSGRTSIWIAPTIPLQFRFSGSRPPALNKTWIDVMSRLSHSSRGLVVVSEEEAEAVKSGEVTISGGID